MVSLMAEPNIVMVRVDNRLIHGQVATQWTSTVGANLLLVANDDVAKSKMRQNLMNMAAPQGVATRYFSIQKTIDVIHKAAPRQHIMIIVETPEDALRLVEGGVPIKKLNIGNMHMSEGKRQVATTVAVNDEDVAAFRSLQDHGVELEIKRVPTTPTEPTEKLFE
jgi:PTS system N-acetylgalactosamine-specific IIB component